MASLLDRVMPLFGSRRTRNAPPTKNLGHMGTAIYGGYVVENEKESSLAGRERYRTFSEILANCSIAAAGIRYFLNLTAKASWTFTPADHPRGEEFAELAEEILTKDPATSWARIIRRAAMYRFYGFSIQEWTARRRDDGLMTFADVAPRAQITIERWDVDTAGMVRGVIQRSPQTQEEIYLPRPKLVYLVDDTLNDSPEGLGLFRHLVKPVERLRRYEQLEGFGFETDLRGIPVGRAPYAELRKAVKDGEIKASDMNAATSPIHAFTKNHIKDPQLGLLLDSETYTTTDESTRPSAQYKYSVELLNGPDAGLAEIATAIERLNREIARILGVEALILGDGDRGSHALSRDKTHQFSLTIDATLAELAEAFAKDLLDVIWQLNGWDPDTKPEMKPEAVQYRDVEQVTAALRDMAQAGAVLAPDDPAINDIRSLLGISPMDDLTTDLDMALVGDTSGPEGEPENPEEDLPERPEDQS